MNSQPFPYRDDSVHPASFASSPARCVPAHDNRSLDGIRSVSPPDKTCAICSALGQCTPQIRVDLVVDQVP